jgi:hypothetical protein
VVDAVHGDPARTYRCIKNCAAQRNRPHERSLLVVTGKGTAEVLNRNSEAGELLERQKDLHSPEDTLGSNAAGRHYKMIGASIVRRDA